MVDQSDLIIDQVSDFEEMNLKTCVDCGTSKTPLWRGGPAGPKSLCNACGIRSRKKRRALMGINKEDKKPKKSTMINQLINNLSIISSEESSSKYDEISLLKKKLLVPFGGKVKVGYQRPRSSNINKLGEVEQAAFLLMALSCKNYLAFL